MSPRTLCQSLRGALETHPMGKRAKPFEYRRYPGLECFRDWDWARTWILATTKGPRHARAQRLCPIRVSFRLPEPSAASPQRFWRSSSAPANMTSEGIRRVKNASILQTGNSSKSMESCCRCGERGKGEPTCCCCTKRKCPTARPPMREVPTVPTFIVWRWAPSHDNSTGPSPAGIQFVRNNKFEGTGVAGALSGDWHGNGGGRLGAG